MQVSRRMRRIGALVFALLATGLVAGASGGAHHKALALQAPSATSLAPLNYDQEAVAKFDANNSWETIRHLSVDIGPRLNGTPQEGQAAEDLANVLRSYGFTATVGHWGPVSTKNVAKVTSPNVDITYHQGGPNWQMLASLSGKLTGDAAPVTGAVVYAGTGQTAAMFPAGTAGKLVLIDYSTTASTRNTAVVNAVAAGAIGVIFYATGTNAAPPGAFTLTTAQPTIPVIAGGRAHGDWIKAFLAQGPLTLTVQTNSYVSPQGSYVIGKRFAVNDPTGTSAPIVMVGAHIDSVLGGPGAHDDASGNGVSMEWARVISEFPLDKEVRVGGFGGEEGGLLGARAYVATVPAAERARFVGEWQMDMVGTPYAPAKFWALTPNGQSNLVVQSMYDSAARIGYSPVQNCKLGQSDHQAFYDVGIPSSLFIWLDYRAPSNCVTGSANYVTEPEYHRPTDTMDNVSIPRLQITLDLVGAAAFHHALNQVAITAMRNGSPVVGGAVTVDCGDGVRNLGSTTAAGALPSVIPHATCDFVVKDGNAVSHKDDVNIFGDSSLVFADFVVPPAIAHTLAPASPDGSNGWYVQDVALGWQIDSGGGTVTKDGCVDETFSTDGTFTRSCSVTNIAGGAGPETVVVKVDEHAPVSTATLAPGLSNGWYATPTLTLGATDGSGSGIARIDYSLDGGAWTQYSSALSGFSTGNHFVQYRATDNAGLQEVIQTKGFKVDGVNPTVTVTTPTAGDSFPLDKVVTAKFKCVDGQSGMDTCVGSIGNGSPLDTSTVGDHTFSVTGTDKAGNTTTVTRHYQVTYTWNGFFAPVTNTETSKLNLVHAGDLIRLGFGLNGNRGPGVLADGFPASTPIACPSWTPHSVPAAGAGATPGLSFGVASGHYTYGWQTSAGWADTCRRFELKLNDGTSTVHTADFMFFA